MMHACDEGEQGESRDEDGMGWDGMDGQAVTE